MSTDKEVLVAWMLSRIEPRTGKSRAALARHLGLDRSQITRLLQGKRPINVNERAMIEEFFGAPPPGSDLRSAGQPGGVRVMGRLGDHLWEVGGDGIAVPERLIGSPCIDYPLDEQKAYELGASSADGEFRAGDFVFTVPFHSYRARPVLDDLVVIERKRGELRNYSLQLVAMTKKGMEMVPVLEGGERAERAQPTQIIGLVIGSYRPRPRR